MHSNVPQTPQTPVNEPSERTSFRRFAPTTPFMGNAGSAPQVADKGIGTGAPQVADKGTAPTHRGQVKQWDFTKGYGFIRPEYGSKDIFMHRNYVKYVPCQVDDWVEYELQAQAGTGKLRAVSVKKFEHPSLSHHLIFGSGGKEPFNTRTSVSSATKQRHKQSSRSRRSHPYRPVMGPLLGPVQHESDNQGATDSLHSAVSTVGRHGLAMHAVKTRLPNEGLVAMGEQMGNIERSELRIIVGRQNEIAILFRSDSSTAGSEAEDMDALVMAYRAIGELHSQFELAAVNSLSGLHKHQENLVLAFERARNQDVASSDASSETENSMVENPTAEETTSPSI